LKEIKENSKFALTITWASKKADVVNQLLPTFWLILSQDDYKVLAVDMDSQGKAM